MYGIQFKLFCILNLVILYSAVGRSFENSHHYDIIGLYQRFQTALSLNDKSSVLTRYLLFNSVNRNIVMENLDSVPQTSKCSKDIVYTLESLKNLKEKFVIWPISLLDSFAKPESGVFVGNVKWLGEYNECIKIYAPPAAPGSTTGNFYGKYCSLAYKFHFLNRSLPLQFGICVPDSCAPQDLRNESLPLIFKAGGYPFTDDESFFENVTITCMPKERHLNTVAISVIVLLSILCAFAVVGSSVTVVKYFKKIIREQKRSSLIINIHDQEHVIRDPDSISKKSVESEDISLLQSDGSSGILKSCEAYLNCFCVFTNGAKLLNTDSSEGQLLCIHGIRFLSMSWVILGHSYTFGVTQSRNIVETEVNIDNFAFQVVLQGFFSVDSFFVLSGFLLSYLVMKEFSRSKGSINWLNFYFHRFIRLTPMYMIVLGFFASVYYTLGSGPYWPLTDYDPYCSKNWWWNLLYINNFVRQSEQCMGWAWYLANDMQFYVISPIFLISLWRWPKIGYSLLGIFLLACILSNFFITYHFDLIIGLAGIKDNSETIIEKFKVFFDKIYAKPYTRIGPYLIGIIAGYILFKNKASNRPKLSRPFLYAGWIVAAAITLTDVYGMYRAHPSLVASSFYNAFNRTVFGIGVAWVIYVCLTNQSDVINRILSYKLFIPLSRLTYAAYLIHPMIITGYYASLKRPLQFSHPTTVISFLGFMVITYALALPVSLILESPIVSLEKLIRGKFNRKQKTESAS